MKVLDVFSQSKPCDTKINLPYIIAEAGVNHEGSMELAKRLIEEAKEGDSDAIKFQTYRAETIASKDSPSYWDLGKEPTVNQYQLFKKYDRFWKKEFEALKRHCDETDIEFISTAFDVESAAFLNDLMDVFKISSSDLNNKPFIDYLCSFGKPIILSTGASYMWEVEQAVSWIKNHGNSMALLHCVLNYPTADENANLAVIPELTRKFPEILVGYSDHTIPKDMKTLEVATLLGARIVEKHFTYDKTLPGNDHYHAMDKNDLKFFKLNLKRLFAILGDQTKCPLPSEEPARKNARRSLVAAKDIPEGAVITSEDLTWKRPAYGISPKHINDVLGKQVTKKVTEDEVLQWGMLQ